MRSSLKCQRTVFFRNFQHSTLLPSIYRRSFWGINKDTASSASSTKNSSLHTFLLKEGNKNFNDSALLSINDYDQALQTQETSEAYAKRAWAYFYIKDYEQAMTDTQTAIKLNPRSVEPYCVAASVKIALNEHQDALEYLKEAMDLTSPIDFRRSSIEQVLNGCKLALKVDSETPSSAEPVQIAANVAAGAHVHSQSTETEEQIASDSDTDEAPTPAHAPALSTPSKSQIDSNTVDLPFDNADFMSLQKDLTQQMCSIGGDEFQAKLMKLNEIPAVQAFQRKALKGEKPDYNDYMALMKDKKFQQYNAVMTEIAKNPKFESVTAKFAQMDWMGAYKELQKDPDALALYMKAFEALDEDQDKEQEQEQEQSQ
eukprot:CAMPEP_0202733398 /NCGR_PEP_ID=MMETSP1385-20130828/188143_1 /ASSEMBLY_ACC=CAM_ASM_000861 /TAXON_ID=933848 /ORGANISM="Elphidium margaritaceum" /LENGTH=370 /DNA_ID=CAMNT_0049399727 /DNA_START=805 /DNA_END=1917 /DNA_ORIENTATION=-